MKKLTLLVFLSTSILSGSIFGTNQENNRTADQLPSKKLFPYFIKGTGYSASAYSGIRAINNIGTGLGIINYNMGIYKLYNKCMRAYYYDMATKKFSEHKNMTLYSSDAEKISRSYHDNRIQLVGKMFRSIFSSPKYEALVSCYGNKQWNIQPIWVGNSLHETKRTFKAGGLYGSAAILLSFLTKKAADTFSKE